MRLCCRFDILEERSFSEVAPEAKSAMLPPTSDMSLWCWECCSWDGEMSRGYEVGLVLTLTFCEFYYINFLTFGCVELIINIIELTKS